MLELAVVVIATVLSLLSALVLKAFPYWKTGAIAAQTLQQAIFISFSAILLNSLYWQIGGEVLIEMLHIFTAEQYRTAGKIIDIVLKGMLSYAGWLHLKSLWLTLPDDLKKEYAVLDMPFYPRRIKLFTNLCKILKRGDKNG